MNEEDTGLRITGLTRRVGAQTILDDITLQLDAGEMLILVGPSGCGKSSLLNAIAGLQPHCSGEIALDGRRIEALSPRERDIAMVFQNYALYPHMSVAENIGFGLEMQGWPRARREARVQEVARMLQLQALLDRRPAQLSGGQRQRVAMGRALARQPRLFLFDEPLSNLDAQLRAEMRSEIKLLHQRVGRSAVYVTHDQTEAMTLGQRIAVLKAGRLQQLGTPQQVYQRPANLFVAQFLASPPMTLLPARLEPEGEFTLTLQGAGAMSWRPTALPVPRERLLGRPLLLGWRAESLRVEEGGAALTLQAPVLLVEPTGVDSLVQLQLGEHRLHWRCAGWPTLQAGDTLTLRLPEAALLVFDAETGERL
ncbi:ATP-binding cassette domain-containing protein [Pelomonas sp. UHG3]|uniref:ATP-binding cassette domain-containing protein n=1 Tax=Roseateles hydrophilus TaxID=2975054 RepID=A0ACC6CD94_9BURK|nr:ATP-binding cassette domain-containing protein [Pelomonas sp. UHG3]MCY4746229.1 ATP-binding cassette domain-containing protein [Pelomonas sp. UHG3]